MREIETAVRDGLAAGKLTGSEKLDVSMTLKIGAVELELTIDGDLALE